MRRTAARDRTAIAPTARQAEFLALECEEALYGGAAGGGKTEGLLLWLAQGHEIPGYSAIIFRRTYPQLFKSGDSVLEKSRRLYRPLGGVWSGLSKQWRFPSGAIIEFGHLTHDRTLDDYQGPSYHRIAFDELTQFPEAYYTYLFSRIRRTVGFPISLGMRAGSNPGGIGHVWVKKRFVTNQAIEALRSLGERERTPPGTIFWANSDRAFVPSRIPDNPHLDEVDYSKKLEHLPPVTRARLKAGDWSISEDGLIKPDYFRHYDTEDATRFRPAAHPDQRIYTLYSGSGQPIRQVESRDCVRFFTIDPAGTSKERARETKGKPPSHSVISAFDWLQQGSHLFVLDVWRDRVTTPDLCRAVVQMQKKWGPAWIGCENTGIGLAVYSELVDRGLPMKALDPGGQDKATRAATLLNNMAEGRVWVPIGAPWMDETETELLAWTGHPDEPFDIGDTWAYAARYAGAARQAPVVEGLYVGRRM